MSRSARVLQFRKFFAAGKRVVMADLSRPELSGGADAVQKAYEDLFIFCHKNHLALPALLCQAEITLIDRDIREHLALRLARWIAAG
jgi:hypothetical protein